MSSLWHLALECSSSGGSVALLEIAPPAAEPHLHSQIILPSDRGSVCSLSPAINDILRSAGLTAGGLESLSVTAGPGSFTGLRVGLATAKMLAMACETPVVAVDTLQAIAMRFCRQHACQPGRPVRLVTALNAFRKQVFTASWLIDAAQFQAVRSACVVDADQWLADPWGAADFDAGDEVWVSGPALSLYTPSAPSQYRRAPEELWQPLAEDVGRLGWQARQLGQAVTALELSPNYIRSSAAEEKRGPASTRAR